MKLETLQEQLLNQLHVQLQAGYQKEVRFHKPKLSISYL